MRDEKLARGEEYKGWTVHKPTSWFFGVQYGCMVLVSWVVSPLSLLLSFRHIPNLSLLTPSLFTP